MMTSDRWQQVKKLLQAALACEPHERATFLDQACAGDAALRAEVLSLRDFAGQVEHFIESPALASATTALSDDQPEARAGQRSGPYKVLREIGHGGMGAVYLATRADAQYRQQIALKIIKRGSVALRPASPMKSPAK